MYNKHFFFLGGSLSTTYPVVTSVGTCGPLPLMTKKQARNMLLTKYAPDITLNSMILPLFKKAFITSNFPSLPNAFSASGEEYQRGGV